MEAIVKIVKKSTGKSDHIKIMVNLRGMLDAEQRRRLMEIAGKCPVHKSLLGGLMKLGVAS